VSYHSHENSAITDQTGTRFDTGRTGGGPVNDRLDELERRADALEAFANSQRQAREWMAEHNTCELVDELRQRVKDRRRIRLGTANTLILLAHIDRLEARP